MAVKDGGDWNEIGSTRLGGRTRLGSGLRFAILCHSPLLNLLKDLGGSTLESQNRKPHPGWTPAAKAHFRMDPRANFLELFCGRDVDSRRRLLTGE